jgi:hypothetical protein
VIDDNLGNTMHINSEARERRIQAEHARIMELRDLELETSLHNTVGDLGYNKLAGLGTENISIPRSYSSGAVLNNFKLGPDGNIISVVPGTAHDDDVIL